MLMPDDKESDEYFHKIKDGTVLSCEIKKVRNYKFHKKWFALLNLGFEYFEPVNNQYKGHDVEKNFDRFRHDITILAGYYTFVYDVQGNPKALAKSISFGSMNQEEFEQLYSKTIDVLLKKVMTRYTKEELDNAINEIIGFI